MTGSPRRLDWLLEAMDGPDLGAIFYVWTSALNDEIDHHGVSLALLDVRPGRTGIKPLDGSDAKPARHTWEVAGVSSHQSPGQVRLTD